MGPRLGGIHDARYINRADGDMQLALAEASKTIIGIDVLWP
jgi:hypothetical protein